MYIATKSLKKILDMKIIKKNKFEEKLILITNEYKIIIYPNT